MRHSRRALIALAPLVAALWWMGPSGSTPSRVERRAARSTPARVRETTPRRHSGASIRNDTGIRRAAQALPATLSRAGHDVGPSASNARPGRADGEAGGRRAGLRARGRRRASRRARPSLAPSASWLSWPRLDPLRPGPAQASVGISGRDPLAPRPLLLWRSSDAGPQLLARGRSGGDGRFDFGQIALPNGGLELIVTDRAGDPRAATPLPVRREALPAPRLLAQPGPPGMSCWRLLPALLAGEFIVQDAGGRDLLHFPIDAPRPLCLSSDTAERAHAIVQRVSDGRRSEARVLHAAQPAGSG